MINNLIKSNKICPDCNSEMLVDTGICLTTYPPQYHFTCPECGKELNDHWPNSTYNCMPIDTGCEHYFEVQVVNGQLVSVCRKCGKIGDRQNYFATGNTY